MPALKSGSQSGGESSHLGKTQGTSKREFARLIGVSDTAVRKAITAGRLTKSLGKSPAGDVFIADVELAKAEWNATSRTAAGVRTIGANQPAAGSHLLAEQPTATQTVAPSPRRVSEPPATTAEPDEELTGQLVFATTLIAAQTAATNERARKLKFENDIAEGRLIPIELVTKEAFESERIIRENILNLPARIAGELAAETDTARVFMRLDAALREALNASADALLQVSVK